jgi:hypothetical protein
LEARRKYIKNLLRILDQLPELITNFRRKYQQKILLFLFFVVLSTIFWIIRSLNEEYEADIQYPVKYGGMPENKVLLSEPPDRLELRVKALGRTILTHKFSYFLHPLKFDVSSYSLNTAGTDSSYILTGTAKEALAQELNDIQILDISPDTLFFRFSEMVTKKVGIKHNIVNFPKIFAKQYMFNGEISFIPDSIIVSGPNSILDTLNCVFTEPLNINNLNDSLERTCLLERIDQVVFSSKKVNLLIPVDKFTELSYLVDINHKNVPDSLVLKTFPNSVRITCRVTLSYYDRVSPEMFEPYVDYNDIEKSISSKLKILIQDVPEYIHSLTLYPSSVEFLIEM